MDSVRIFSPHLAHLITFSPFLVQVASLVTSVIVPLSWEHKASGSGVFPSSVLFPSSSPSVVSSSVVESSPVVSVVVSVGVPWSGIPSLTPISGSLF
jgi:hypothetical protein